MTDHLDILDTIKNVSLKVRLTQAEHLHIKTLATQACMSVSDYIRKQLFGADMIEDTSSATDKSRFNCDHDKELMKLLVRVYLLMKQQAKVSLPEEEYKASLAQAQAVLSEWGYE